MTQDWIIDVLTDLQKFARKNDLTRLADQLDDTVHIAGLDIAAQEGGAGSTRTNDEANTVRLLRTP